MKRVFMTVGMMCLLACAFLTLFLAAPGLFGLRACEVATGSMEPLIPAGSTAYVHDAGGGHVSGGDVVAFLDGDGDEVLHRVMGSYRGMLVTKGDANLIPDPDLIWPSAVTGSLAFVLPGAGILAPACGLLGCLGLALVTASVSGRWKRNKNVWRD